MISDIFVSLTLENLKGIILTDVNTTPSLSLRAHFELTSFPDIRVQVR